MLLHFWYCQACHESYICSSLQTLLELERGLVHYPKVDKLSCEKAHVGDLWYLCKSTRGSLPWWFSWWWRAGAVIVWQWSRCWAVWAARLTGPWGHTTHLCTPYHLFYSSCIVAPFPVFSILVFAKDWLSLCPYDCTVWENNDFLSFGLSPIDQVLAKSAAVEEREEEANWWPADTGTQSWRYWQEHSGHWIVGHT